MINLPFIIEEQEEKRKEGEKIFEKQNRIFFLLFLKICLSTLIASFVAGVLILYNLFLMIKNDCDGLVSLLVIFGVSALSFTLSMRILKYRFKDLGDKLTNKKI